MIFETNDFLYSTSIDIQYFVNAILGVPAMLQDLTNDLFLPQYFRKHTQESLDHNHLVILLAAPLIHT